MKAPAQGRPLRISFSGIDGAGKSTQIERLTQRLTNESQRVQHVSFWDDVVLLRRLRERTGHAIFKGEKGIGTPERPVRRRDKNVQTWYTAPIRISLCVLDAVGLALLLRKVDRRHDVDVVIFDRYLYDQMANFNLQNGVTHRLVRLILMMIPRPDVGFVLDADPDEACARKPEYPLEFVRRSRNAYLELSKLANMKVVAAGSPQATEEFIWRELEPWLPLTEPALASSEFHQ